MARRPRGAAEEARQAMLGDLDDDVSAEQQAAELAFDGEEEDEGEDRDAELVAVLQAEEAASIGLDGDEVAGEQIAAFDRYLGRDYGDEIDGVSRVHTREVFETIEAIRPKFMRMFGGGAKAITVEPWEEGAEQAAQEVQDFVRAALFGDPEKLDGHAIFDDFFFDGALMKIGVGCVDFEPEELGSPVTEGGLVLQQVQALQAEAQKPEGEIELLAVEDEPGGTYQVTVQKVRKKACVILRVIPPEDFRCARTAKDLSGREYKGDVVRMALSEVKSTWPDLEEEIEEAGSGDQLGAMHDERRQARFWDQDESGFTFDDSEDPEVEVMREYIRFDHDGDGYPELRECWRLGTLLLETIEVDDNPYFSWTPIRIPHRLIGLSIADIESDIQRTNTVHLRNANTSSGLAVAPRKTVHPAHVNMPDLLNVRIGGVIRMNPGSNKLPGEVIQTEVTPDMSGAALKMMEKMDRLSERRTGVTEHGQGLNPDVLNKTMGGIDLLQSAAGERIEAYARNMAAGLGLGLTKFVRMYVTHMKGAQRVKVGRGKFREFVPSNWSKEVQVGVHVGRGTGNSQVRISQLMGILAQQKELVASYGLANPIVTPKHLHNTIEKITQEMGFLSADEFFADPASLPEEQLKAMMQPKPDPKAQAAQMDMQIKQQDLQLQVQKLQQDMQIAMTKLQQEGALKREQMGIEAELAREEIQVDAMAKVAGASVKMPRTQVGGDKV